VAEAMHATVIQATDAPLRRDSWTIAHPHRAARYALVDTSFTSDQLHLPFRLWDSAIGIGQCLPQAQAKRHPGSGAALEIAAYGGE
jgi:hypothetical protein